MPPITAKLSQGGRGKRGRRGKREKKGLGKRKRRGRGKKMPVCVHTPASLAAH